MVSLGLAAFWLEGQNRKSNVCRPVQCSLGSHLNRVFLSVMGFSTAAGLANNQFGGNFTLGINFSFSFRIN